MGTIKKNASLTVLFVFGFLFGTQATDDATHISKRAVGDILSRRSAVDKNFIRFGRSFHDGTGDKNVIARVSRAAKDNFMRFGRADSELYFSPAPDNALPTAQRGGNFMRFGRNFMRFGRAKDNFMRFGRAKDNFMRFGRGFNKSELENLFSRTARNDQEDPEIDDDGPEVEQGDLDLQADKPKNGPVIRIRRDAPTTLWEIEGRDGETEGEGGKTEQAKRSLYPALWQVNDETGVADLLIDPDTDLLINKRNNGDTGFIRFG